MKKPDIDMPIPNTFNVGGILSNTLSSIFVADLIASAAVKKVPSSLRLIKLSPLKSSTKTTILSCSKTTPTQTKAPEIIRK